MANTKTHNLSYQGLSNFLGSKQSKILANNTLVYKDGITIQVQYHNSVIAVLRDYETILSNDGYFTHTTKERLNWFLNLHGLAMSQDRGVWKVYQYKPDYKELGVFSGSCTIDSSGNVTGLDSTGTERKEVLKAIKKFAHAYVNELIEGKIELPSGGDCWDCLMFSKSRVSWNHIASHIEESYYVPSLLVRAIEHKDVSIYAKGLLPKLWQGQEASERESFITDQYKKSLIAYMLHCYDQSTRQG